MRQPSKEWEALPQGARDIIISSQNTIPVKVGDIAAKFGILVKVTTLEVGISGMIEPVSNSESGFKITINKHEPKHRQRFTLAHEISHYLLHRNLIGIGLRDNVLYRSKLSDEKEAEANRLASDILMPKSSVREWVRNFGQGTSADYVCRIASHFEVSEEAMRISLGLK